MTISFRPAMSQAGVLWMHEACGNAAAMPTANQPEGLCECGVHGGPHAGWSLLYVRVESEVTADDVVRMREMAVDRWQQGSMTPLAAPEAPPVTVNGGDGT